MTSPSDPRPLYRSALEWVRALLAGVSPEQLDQPTGCPEFDVRMLAGHIVATVRKLAAVGDGGDPRALPPVATGIPDGGILDAFDEAATAVWKVWEDDATLTATVTAPWGPAPGADAVWGFLNETLVHGWDLATATDQDPEADPGTVTPLLAMVDRFLPAEPRGGVIPFDPPVEPAAGAGPTERLANWSGRKSGAHIG